MLRKALPLGMVFIFALSLLLVSMITCFTYDAEAHNLWWCEDCEDKDPCDTKWSNEDLDPPWNCQWWPHHTGE